MKNIQLEKLFLEYLNSLASQDSNEFYMKDDEKIWLLFGKESYHLNIKNNTLYIKPLDILIKPLFEDDVKQTATLDWVAFQQDMLTKEYQLIIGTGNPYNNDKLSIFVKSKKVVRAIPFSIQKKIKLDK